ncbi:MAG: hypothetical protein V7K35_18295 [Nostoc sp.]|uniref:hypothetical protein n=1 Tax=Nostoc sp. TaxID=1180 RepID=UPI002FF88A9A
MQLNVNIDSWVISLYISLLSVVTGKYRLPMNIDSNVDYYTFTPAEFCTICAWLSGK